MILIGESKNTNKNGPMDILSRLATSPLKTELVSGKRDRKRLNFLAFYPITLLEVMKE